MEDKWLELLKQGKCLTERDVKMLCEKVFYIKIGKRNSCRRV